MAYTKKTWVNGEVIDAAKLNNIESGVAASENTAAEAKAAAAEAKADAAAAKTSAAEAKADVQQSVQNTLQSLQTFDNRVSELEENALTEADKPGIVTDTLNALAGADPNNATAAVVQELSGRTDVLERKFRNAAEDISQIQQETNELELSYIENMVRIACRLVQIERTLNLQPPISTDGFDTTTDADGIYDNMEWQ